MFYTGSPSLPDLILIDGFKVLEQPELEFILFGSGKWYDLWMVYRFRQKHVQAGTFSPMLVHYPIPSVHTC